MHSNIAAISPLIGKRPPHKTDPSGLGTTCGITGFVYRSVRGVTRVVGSALGVGLSQLEPLLRGKAELPQREALLSALNGVLGDYLVITQNALAIEMQIRQHAAPIQFEGQTGGKLLVAVHGLCMNDQHWLHGEGDQAHNHAGALAQDLGYRALYLHYNTGLAIASNGAAFADQLEGLVNAWPVPITELSLLCHSMGGLVSRSALLHAQSQAQQHRWPKLLKHLVFLGTPHHGAPLERAGSWIDYALGISPYSAPLATLGLVRSQGIQDLRHGRVWANAAESYKLPARLKCHAIAASRQKQRPGQSEQTEQIQHSARFKGDGLVPVSSALGVGRDPETSLNIPKARQLVVFDIDHFQLLSSPQVHAYLKRQLAK
jgi:hypothetical protein